MASTVKQEVIKKPADQGAYININVKNQKENRKEVKFLLKRNTPIKKLKKIYCDRLSLDFNSITFLFKGISLSEERTPDELELDDGDEIDAIAEGAMQEDKKPPNKMPHIIVKVKNQDNVEAFYKIKRDSPLLELMNLYCEDQSVELGSVRFLLDGHRLRGDKTPDNLGWKMEMK